MNTRVKLIVAATAVLLVAVAGCQPQSGSGGAAGEPTIAQSPSAALLASGSFRAKGSAVELSAIGAGDSVTGTMIVGETGAPPLFAVDFACARTAEDGRILIAGDTTESNADWATKGELTAIVFKPGSPVHAVFGFENDAPSPPSCSDFLDEIVDLHFATAVGDGALEPIDGTVELRQ